MKLTASSRLPVSLHPLRAASWFGAVLFVLLTLPDLVSGHALAQQDVPPEAESAEAPAVTTPAVVAAPEPVDAPTAREKELLEKIRKLKAPRWRSFGACQYDWTAWRLSAKGVRTTNFRCGDPPITGNVAVFCPSLRISRQVADAQWESWRLPLSLSESAATGGEDQMVANLCANARPLANTPSEAPAQPGAASQPKASPGPVKPAAKPAALPAP
ncbi:hypothetical protein KBY93_05220 [Synechococcus sp. J7-Johnson]|uniref:hypothetical protein n=1 Tax=Synechococcus sp. J7-Johnson TaxID=2823737 RepID=UPI0020CCDEFF|nr:hypothetical protein [Synechococcus sp. J7-Johnson]MCP9840036.1 hypothetical protein [Synechococcus sp. J7-Johnson]